jgi:hypothetical protein
MPDTEGAEPRPDPPNLWLVRAWMTLLAWSKAADDEQGSNHREQRRREPERDHD